jgi:hypothetical protein
VREEGLSLLFASLCGGCPHFENFRGGLDEVLGIAVALQTPLHVEGFGFGDEGHPVDPPVAGGTADAFLDMDAVVEEDMIGETVHSVPPDRFPSQKTFADRFEQFGIGPKLGVAFHANLGCGDSGGVGFLDMQVAKSAVNP